MADWGFEFRVGVMLTFIIFLVPGICAVAYYRRQTPSCRKPGCAYLDTCLAYVDEPDRVTVEVDRSPTNNIYLRIPHALMDPVQADAEHRLMRSYMTTFWHNIDVFKCQQVGRSFI